MTSQKIIEKNSDKRKAIMDACLKLFCTTCFQDTSTAKISQQAGVATGTLFLYFENKEELVNELYLECKEAYAAYVEEGVWEHTSFKAQIRHIWDRNLQWKRDNPDKNKFMKQFCSSPALTNVTQEKATIRLRLMNDVVKQAIDNKEVAASSTKLLSAMISGYFHIAALFLLEHPQSKNFKKWSDEGFNFIWKGIN
jgi:AcrR family transcriptional regulator